MSTRSNIAVQFEDGSISSISCHYDGYVKSGVGEALHTKVKNPEEVLALIGMGELQSLDIKNGAIPYADGRQARRYNSEQAYMRDMRTMEYDYFYLYKLGQWYFCKAGNTDYFKPVADVFSTTN